MTGLLLAGVGSGRRPETWSGIPFHLLKEGQSQGLIERDLELDVMSRAWKARRISWNLGSVVTGRGRGGYQFTERFLERLWRNAREQIQGRHLLNWTPIYPNAALRDASVRRSFFIDQTLGQLFDVYGVRTSIRRDVAEDALRREAEGYHTATAIVVHSEWARQAVLTIDGVDPDRVHVVVPGANLDEGVYQAWIATGHRRSETDGGPLRAVFVGRHPIRKGLDRLLRAFRIARARGVDLTLDVVGTRPDEVDPDLRRIGGVVWHGLVDKSADPFRFFEIVANADVGCLLSRAEAGGIGLREYHSLGLAVIGPDVGGSPDHVIREAAVLVSPDAADEEIAGLLAELAGDPVRVAAMREVSRLRRAEVGWPTTVSRLREVLG
jgi:glycosyltransferase involved in cell wall biosynthesis